MAVSVTHVDAADGTFSPEGEAAWEREHTVTGLGDAAEKNVGTAAGDVAAGNAPAAAQAAAEATAAAALATHEAAANPHPTYLTQAEGDAAYEATGAVSTHAGAADPHTGYQKESEKGVANGYASLDADGLVPDAQIPSAIARDSEVTTAVSNHAGAADPHTGYQKESEKDAASGYAGLDANGKVDYARIQNVSATSRILGRRTAGAGVVEEMTLSQVLDLIASAADGDILYRTGGAWARLPKGTDGQVLTLASGLPSWANAGGGSDPWTYQVLTADFTTSSTTVGDVTQGELLGFAPQANTKYVFEANLMLRTATATVNPRVGFAWATGLTDGVCTIEESQSATAQILSMGNPNAALLTAVGGLANNSQSWPAFVFGTVIAGATPSGNCRIQLSTETAGTVVRVVAGSWLRYRSFT